MFEFGILWKESASPQAEEKSSEHEPENVEKQDTAVKPEPAAPSAEPDAQKGTQSSDIKSTQT